jgi:uncharacterized membrane protein YqgA involved in biofilm formation
MLGPLVNGAALLCGSFIGAGLGRWCPERIRQSLPLTCGVISISIGSVLVGKVHTLPAVALAMLLGAFIGELIKLEKGLEYSIVAAQNYFERRMPPQAGKVRVDGFISKFISLLVLFCASGMGVFGSINEGMTGQASILLAKSVLDLFTALIFASNMGLAVALIAIPQLLIQSVLFFSAHLLTPLTTPNMLNDFSACGGVIMLATGLRICGIKIFPVVNMLPALLLALPCSWLWTQWF